MAKLENTYNIALTAAGGTFTLDLTTKKEVIDIRSSGTITLVANVNITHTAPALGTPEDLYVKMRWVANVIPSTFTVTIFGTQVPANILDKDFIIDCHRASGGWEVKFLLDANSCTTLYSGADSVAHDGNNGSVSTANMAGIQVLKTLNYTGRLFETAGDRIRLSAGGTATANGNLKCVGFSISDGVNSINIGGATGAIYQGNWVAEAMFIATHIGNGEYKTTGIVLSNNGRINNSSPNSNIPAFNFASTSWTLALTGTEVVPTGSEVTAYSFNIERIKVA